MPAPATLSRFRLVGIGRCTKGLAHDLEPGQPVVLGRHPDCTIVVQRTPAGSDASLGFVSRQHAVVEEDPPQGWCVHDSGSANGTALLRRGLPPATRLKPGVRYPLQPDDVIELAGSDEFQFVFQLLAADRPVLPPVPAPARAAAPAPPDDGRTQRVFASTHVALQRLVEGQAVDLYEIDDRDLEIRLAEGQVVCRRAGETTAGEVLARVRRDRSGALLLGERDGVLRNLEPLVPGQRVALRDKDLLTLRGAARSAFLFLDPRELPTRPLSDLLMAADRITIGSAADNSCRVIDPSVSRHHAEVWREGAELMVRDLGSANGTTVDGRRVFDPLPLTRGSAVTFGRLPFVADAAAWRQAPPPAPSIDIRFVGVSVELAGKLRLRQVSLGIGQGEMVGVLGPSASGKSTLLKALASQHRLADGEIYVNGRPMSRGDGQWSWFTSLMGYRSETYEVGFVQQIDLLQAELTVREVLEFAARHMGHPAPEARGRAERAGEQCNLGPLMDRVALFGNGQLNLSGGQLKRVCVAVEVLREPRILVLDEPTTGQDPKNTDDLMNLFRALAQSGVTLLMSTHDLRNLALFDKVIVLCLGHLVYYGPPDGFASHFGAPTAEDVYASLPDREDRLAEAEALGRTFRTTSLYKRYCEAGS